MRQIEAMQICGSPEQRIVVSQQRGALEARHLGALGGGGGEGERAVNQTCAQLEVGQSGLQSSKQSDTRSVSP